ncbi:MAG TPA: host attachment protein [Geminicoccaceae bacterium]|nr:host attachment protein [Geminicoccaceae bacterium]
MPKPIIWVLVADASRARLFRVEQPQLALRAALDEELIGSNLPSREIASDRPGRTFDRGGQGRHAMEPPTDPARYAQEVFARDIGRLLDEKRKSRLFERLVVVAPPQFLGDLRAAMPQHLRGAVGAEVAKDLSKLPPHELEEHLRDVLEALWPRGRV